MIYAPITSSPPLPSPAYRGYGHARAKNILAKCDSRVSLSSSTDVVEAIKSEAEAASRGLKRNCFIHTAYRPRFSSSSEEKKKKKERKIHYSPKRYVWRIEEAALPHRLLIPPSSLVWCFGEAYPEREVNQSAQHILPFTLVPHFEATFSVQIALSSQFDLPSLLSHLSPDCKDRFEITRVP